MTPGIGIGLDLAGKGIGALAGAAAARKQNGILTQGVRAQDRAGGEAAGVAGDFISQLRSSAPQPAFERGAFTQALGNPGVMGPATGSARFRNDAATVGAGAHDYGTQLAALFARIRAPQLQRQNESQLMANMGNAVRPIQANAQDSQFLTQLRAGMVQPNPWAQLVGKGLSNAGSYAVSHG